MKIVDQTYTLSNGVKIPKIGLGTWQSKPGNETYDACMYALKHGYHLIDTAAGYRNEESVGRALKDSKVKREDVFITTKLESHIKTYEGALEAFNASLKALDVDYIDLYLIHAPWPWSEMGKNCDEGNVEAYKAMEKMYKEGKVKAIGVSNFDPSHLENIINHCEIVPHVNQIGYFIGLDQSKTIDYCNDKNIFIEAYSPLGIGFLLDNETIIEVAKNYKVSPAQICIRYLLQKGVTPIPKTIREHRVIENIQVDFEIKAADMARLDQIKGDPRRWD